MFIYVIAYDFDTSLHLLSQYCPERCFNAVPCCPVRMRIRKPKNITLTQLAVVTGVGVSGGIYIYKPLFEKFWFGNKPEAIKTPVETPANP